jgi:hypothetical protein
LIQKVHITKKGQKATINVTGLNDKLVYDVYLTAENDYPVYKQLMNNTKVARVTCKTLKRRSNTRSPPLSPLSIEPLNVYSINSSLWLSISALLAALFTLAFTG